MSSIRSRLFEFEKARLRELERIIVVGDVHGDYDSIRSLLRLAELEKDFLVFLGDYADRGWYGVEVIDTVAALLKEHSWNVVALKGNHEDYTREGEPAFYPCTLIEEAVRKKGGWRDYFLEELKPFIENLYLAALIPGEVLLVHGGVSSKVTGVKDLRQPTRIVETDILWSDPFEGYGEYPNRRGAGVEFGIDITEKVCRRIGVKRIIRSHEPRKAVNGPCYEHGGRVVTISSTSVYRGKPFVLIIDPIEPSNISYSFLNKTGINSPIQSL